MHAPVIEVGLPTLLRGYDAAFERLAPARAGEDPLALYIPLFEVLNWAVAVDDRLGQLLGKSWHGTHRRSGVNSGFRYIRNRVHHQWADAMYLAGEIWTLASGQQLSFQDWHWRPVHELPPTSPEHAKQQAKLEPFYTRHLAGRTARHTFKDLHQLFNWAEKRAPA